MGVESKASGRGAPWSTVPPPKWTLDDSKLRGELLRAPQSMTDAVRLELWRTISKVEFWAGAADRANVLRGEKSPHVRERQDAAIREADHRLSDALGVIITEITSPEHASAAKLAIACALIAEWADAQGLAESAVRYAEGAAVLGPESPEAANRAGRLCRRAGYRHRAEVSLGRATRG